jgi:hypothetical protein
MQYNTIGTQKQMKMELFLHLQPNDQQKQVIGRYHQMKGSFKHMSDTHD